MNRCFLFHAWTPWSDWESIGWKKVHHKWVRVRRCAKCLLRQIEERPL